MLIQEMHAAGGWGMRRLQSFFTVLAADKQITLPKLTGKSNKCQLSGHRDGKKLQSSEGGGVGSLIGSYQPRPT